MRRVMALLLCAAGVSTVYGKGAETVQSPIFNMAGAKSTAMGRAFSAVAGEIDTISINPAGAAAIDNPWIAASYQRGVVDDNSGYVHYAQPIPWGALFIGGNYFDAGTIDLNQSDGTTGTRHAQQDLAGLFGFGIGKRWLSIGASAKVFKLELAEEATANGYALDAGALLQTPFEGLAFGAGVQNMGPDVKFEVDEEPLPQRVRYGTSYLMDFGRWGGSYKVLVAVDGVSEKDEDAAVQAGLDISHDLSYFDAGGSVSLRGGYQSQTESYTGGLGLVIGSFIIDYAISFHSELDESHFATLGYRFATVDNSDDVQKPSIRSRRQTQ